MKPSGHMEIKETKGGGRVYFNGVELFVVEDGLTVHGLEEGIFPLVTMTFAPHSISITGREDD